MPKDERGVTSLGDKIKETVDWAEHKTDQLKHNANAEGHAQAADHTSGFSTIGHRLDEAKEKIAGDMKEHQASQDWKKLND